ncbi:unnamed protein product, partial [Heterosigma akashiwo]
TGGIGKGIALRLAKARVSVTIVGRNHVRGAQVVEEMGALSGPDATHRFIACDAMLLANVPECVRTYKEANDKLDYLVLTQGIATIQGRTETAEGLDEKLAVHVYSRMAFVDHLLPLLRGSAGTRVLSVLSGRASTAPRVPEDPDLRENYPSRTRRTSRASTTTCAWTALPKKTPAYHLFIYLLDLSTATGVSKFPFL